MAIVTDMYYPDFVSLDTVINSIGAASDMDGSRSQFWSFPPKIWEFCEQADNRDNFQFDSRGGMGAVLRDVIEDFV
jgi:hypothetical protein